MRADQSQRLICFAQLAFTRAESLIGGAVITLLAAVVLPALAHDRARSQRVICANNLRQIGIAMQVWGNDHGDLQPQELFVANGGTRQHPLAAVQRLSRNDSVGARISVRFGVESASGYGSPGHIAPSWSDRYLVKAAEPGKPFTVPVSSDRLDDEAD